MTMKVGVIFRLFSVWVGKRRGEREGGLCFPFPSPSLSFVFQLFGGVSTMPFTATAVHVASFPNHIHTHTLICTQETTEHYQRTYLQILQEPIYCKSSVYLQLISSAVPPTVFLNQSWQIEVYSLCSVLVGSFRLTGTVVKAFVPLWCQNFTKSVLFKCGKQTDFQFQI